MSFESLTKGFELKDLLAILTAIGLGVGFLLTRESGQTRAAAQIEALARAQSELVTEVREINKSGTTGSQLAITTLREVNTENTRRIGALEKNVYDMNEKLTDIQAKLVTISSLLEGKHK